VVVIVVGRTRRQPLLDRMHDILCCGLREVAGLVVQVKNNYFETSSIIMTAPGEPSAPPAVVDSSDDEGFSAFLGFLNDPPAEQNLHTDIVEERGATLSLISTTPTHPTTRMTIEGVETEAGSAEAVLLEKSQRFYYPDPFYCMLTRKVMTDPVVGADGYSFERSAVLERDDADAALQQKPIYYPNRALQTIIDKEKYRIKELLRALLRAGDSLRTGFQQVLENSALPTGEYRLLPDAYYCPITLDIMIRPAIDPEGNTYERPAILGWIRANGNSPLTRNALSAEQLRDNNALDDLIDAEVNKTEGSIHPSIRRWKDSRNEPEDEESSPYPASQEEIDELSHEDEESGPYPTSQEEIDELSTENVFAVCSCIAFVFLIIGVCLGCASRLLIAHIG